MGSLTIKKKLILGLSGAVLAIIFLGLISVYTNQKIVDTSQGALSAREEMYFLKEKEVQHLDWLTNLSRVFLFGENFTGQLDHSKCDFGNWYYNYLESDAFKAKPEAYRQTVLAMEEPHRLLHGSAERINNYFNQGDLERAEQVFATETNQHLSAMRRLIIDAESQLLEIVSREEAEAASTSELGMYITFISIGGIVILTIIVAIILLKATITPITTIITRVKDIAQGEGDLTKRININTKDEIGELAKWIDMFIDNVHNIVKSVSQSAQELTASSEEMAASSSQASTATQQISTSIQQVAIDADQQNHSIVQASQALIQLASLVQLAQDKAVEANQSSEETRNKANDGRVKVNTVVSAMESINQKSQDTGQVVQELNRLSTQVGEIIGTINGIAAQIDLLALNAAIEAARAGEHGRGFSVVAEEVRKLSEQSHKGASEIAALVNEMVKQTEKAVESMDSGKSAIENGVMVVSETDQFFADIITAVEKTVVMINEIVDVTNDEVATSDQVVELINSVATITENTAANSQEVSAATEEQSAAIETVAASAEEASAMANSLDSLIRRFKI